MSMTTGLATDSHRHKHDAGSGISTASNVRLLRCVFITDPEVSLVMVPWCQAHDEI